MHRETRRSGHIVSDNPNVKKIFVKGSPRAFRNLALNCRYPFRKPMLGSEASHNASIVIGFGSKKKKGIWDIPLNGCLLKIPRDNAGPCPGNRWGWGAGKAVSLAGHFKIHRRSWASKAMT